MLKNIANTAVNGICCSFCNEFAGLVDNEFSHLYGECSRLIGSTPSLYVVPSLGQLAEGHLLIIPNRHVMAFADLQNGELSELDEVLTEYGTIVHQLYGPYVLFEHGTRSANSGGCGIVHAHLHLVPCAPEVCIPPELRMRAIALPTFTHLPQTVSRMHSYVFFRDQRMNSFVAEVDYLPSQYFRRLVADVSRVPVWDWRQAARQDSLTRTLDRLRISSSL